MLFLWRMQNMISPLFINRFRQNLVKMDSLGTVDDSLFNEVETFFLKMDKLHDVQFIVGEQKEKIKAVRLQLISQSKAWWSMLSEDSPLVEKGDIYLPDIDPEVFNLLLKHCYGGLPDLDDLSDDIVIKLCYCANKYFMKSLFKKISTRLQPKEVKDLFPAFHCLLYFNLQGVEESVKKMIQTQTTNILDHPEFLECDVDSVTYICKQESLNCDELTLWKAVVKWAKHKAQSDEGAQLRQCMSSPLQHIRLTTLSAEDLRDHVFSLVLFNVEEIASICKGGVSNSLILCSKKNKRCVEKTVDIKHDDDDNGVCHTSSKSSSSSFVTKDQCINLKSIVTRGFSSGSLVDINIFSLNVKVTITRVIDLMNTNDIKYLKEDPIIIQVNNFQHHRYNYITIPTLINGKEITLMSKSRYLFELSFSQHVPCKTSPDCHKGHDFNHGIFFCSLSYTDGRGENYCHIQRFTYQVAR